MTITPDTKDWTWVLSRPCPDCGLTASSVGHGEVGRLLRGAAVDLIGALRASDATTRPAPDVWSPLEYACHVRDVFRIFLTRLELILGEDDPLFANWDQDATAVQDRYDEQDPLTVADELGAAAEALAARFDGLPDDPALWARPGRRSDGAAFTLETFSQYLVHDPVHHVWDVQSSRR
jgi:hypothetical protein